MFKSTTSQLLIDCDHLYIARVIREVCVSLDFCLFWKAISSVSQQSGRFLTSTWRTREDRKGNETQGNKEMRERESERERCSFSLGDWIRNFCQSVLLCFARLSFVEE